MSDCGCGPKPTGQLTSKTKKADDSVPWVAILLGASIGFLAVKAFNKRK